MNTPRNGRTIPTTQTPIRCAQNVIIDVEMEIHMRSTNGSIEYRLNGETALHSIPLKRHPIPELLAHLGLSGCNWTWQWENSQGMSITITVEDCDD